MFFCGNPNAGKPKLMKFLLIDFAFTYWKRWNFSTLTLRCGKFNQENMYHTLSPNYQNWPRFVKDMTKTFWCFFIHSPNCCSLAKCECKVSQGRVETLFRWGGKH